MVVPPVSAASKSFGERLTEWLNEPGVRVVVVEFYSDYCEPCKEAASKGYADAYYYIGRTCQTQGKMAEAIKAFRKFIRLRPGSARAFQAKQALMAMGASP